MSKLGKLRGYAAGPAAAVLVVVVVVTLAFAGFHRLLASGLAVAFRSLESVTESGAPVHNRIVLFPGARRDVWVMQQSHAGRGGHPDQNWDRLAIVVDKSTALRTATFYQLDSGPLAWDASRQKVPYKARCFACHANGPRALRADTENLSLTPREALQIAAMNLRIKAYGRVRSQADPAPAPRGAPFRAASASLTRTMPLESCVRCHASEGGIREALTFEHAGTARFLVERGRMPPFPFRVSEKDRRVLERLTPDAPNS